MGLPIHHSTITPRLKSILEVLDLTNIVIKPRLPNGSLLDWLIGLDDNPVLFMDSWWFIIHRSSTTMVYQICATMWILHFISHIWNFLEVCQNTILSQKSPYILWFMKLCSNKSSNKLIPGVRTKFLKPIFWIIKLSREPTEYIPKEPIWNSQWAVTQWSKFGSECPSPNSVA